MYLHVKRTIDILLSLIGLIVLSPVILIITVLIKLTSKGPIFFRQKRVGKNKSYFYILKFRTMKITTPKYMPTSKLEDPDQYITRLGKFLRKTSLDEIPQIVNIISGKMSLIGPRPVIWNEYELINERDKYTGKYGLTPNEIRPGLTGWAQVNGRDNVDNKEKAKLDGEYVAKISFWFDFKCLCKTIAAVLKGEGVVEGKKKKKPKKHRRNKG